jgi:hypothetical protein
MYDLRLALKCPICRCASHTLSVSWVVDGDGRQVFELLRKCQGCKVHSVFYARYAEMPSMPCTEAMSALRIVEVDCE